MSGKVCRETRLEIDQSELRQTLSTEAEAHVATCALCASFRTERSRLRELVGALGLRQKTLVGRGEFGVGALHRRRPFPDHIFQIFHFSPELVVQIPFLRERVRQLERFHGVKRLFENEQPVAMAKLGKHLTP